MLTASEKKNSCIFRWDRGEFTFRFPRSPHIYFKYKWLHRGIVKGIAEPTVLILFSATFRAGIHDTFSDLWVSLILWGHARCSAGIAVCAVQLIYTYQHRSNMTFAEQVACCTACRQLIHTGCARLTACGLHSQYIHGQNVIMRRIYDIQQIDGSSQESRELAG